MEKLLVLLKKLLVLLLVINIAILSCEIFKEIDAIEEVEIIDDELIDDELIEEVLSSEKELSLFHFTDFNNSLDISDTYMTVLIPDDMDMTNLIATFETTGETVTIDDVIQISGETSNDFSSPIIYTVTAVDGSNQDYNILVTNPTNSSKEIIGFELSGSSSFHVDGVISGTDIAVTAHDRIDLTKLTTVLTTTGTSVNVGGTPQENLVTENDFTNPVTYTVIAIDGSTQDYTVKFTVTPLAFGDIYGGGFVFYLDENGGGLVAANSDNYSTAVWIEGGTTQSTANGQTAYTFGKGLVNTNAITNQSGHTGSAAQACLDYIFIGKYSDWYLPSLHELDKMFENLHKNDIGNFKDDKYWSSSEMNNSIEGKKNAMSLQFNSARGDWVSMDKSDKLNVRAIRQF